MPFLSLFSTVGLFARPPSHVSSQSQESILPSSPRRMGLDQTCTSHSSESSGISEAASNLPKSPSSFVVKEEPCDTVLIKWEKSEERFGEHQENTSSPCQDRESPSVKSNICCLLIPVTRIFITLQGHQFKLLLSCTCSVIPELGINPDRGSKIVKYQMFGIVQILRLVDSVFQQTFSDLNLLISDFILNRKKS